MSFVNLMCYLSICLKKVFLIQQLMVKTLQILTYLIDANNFINIAI